MDKLGYNYTNPFIIGDIMLNFINSFFQKKELKSPLMPDATFSLLIQINNEGKYEISIHSDKHDDENAVLIGSLLYDIFNDEGLLNVVKAFDNYPTNDTQLEFCKNTLLVWKSLAQKKLDSQKRKIDPTTIFTIGSRKNEQ